MILQTNLTVVVSLWLLGVAVGLACLWSYAYEPGRPASAPGLWPEESSLRRRPEQPTLVFLAHPRCPCTRASLGELDRLMAQCRGELFAYVLFYRPPDAEAGWERSDLWEHASTIPGVEVRVDEDGAEAARFGASVSGQVVLFDRDGSLLFHGGITAGRGHSGDNDGRSAIIDHVRGARPQIDETPVYGCAIEPGACAPLIPAVKGT